MTAPELPLLDAERLRALVGPATGCDQCEALRCDSWESVSAPLGPPLLLQVGTLRDPAIDEPRYDELLPTGMDTWHPRAPVAVLYAPYNRSTGWCCPQCRRGFLQYTEHGGYYVDHRLRVIDPALICD